MSTAAHPPWLITLAPQDLVALFQPCVNQEMAPTERHWSVCYDGRGDLYLADVEYHRLWAIMTDAEVRRGVHLQYFVPRVRAIREGRPFGREEGIAL